MAVRIKNMVLIVTLLLNASLVINAQLDISADVANTHKKAANPRYLVKRVELPSGIRLEYAQQGASTGTPVIFLHGYTDSWQSFNQVLPLLPDSIQAYAVSLRGHGDSDQPKKGYEPGDLALDIAEFMQELQIESGIIVGHSMGATVAQRFALDYPYMTKALVLISSFASFKSNAGIAELQAAIDALQDPIDKSFVYEFQKGTSYRQLEPALLQTYVNESLKVPAHVWKEAGRNSLTVDYTKQLKEIHAPTLIIWGDKDSFCPEGDQHILNKAIKRSTLVKYHDVGHAAHWEVPQKVTDDLLQFIGKVETSK